MAERIKLTVDTVIADSNGFEIVTIGNLYESVQQQILEDHEKISTLIENDYFNVTENALAVLRKENEELRAFIEKIFTDNENCARSFKIFTRLALEKIGKSK